MPQAKRPEIEELLTLLFDEIEPKDERVTNFRKRVETQLKKRLKYRKNILKQPWFKKRIQVAFDASQKRLQQNIHSILIFVSIKETRRKYSIPVIYNFSTNFPKETLNYIPLQTL